MLSQITILVRSISKSREFYSLLFPKYSKENHSFSLPNNVLFSLKSAGEVGFNLEEFSPIAPMLTVTVDNIDDLVPQLIQAGGDLCGSIEFTPYGRIAPFRCPDGYPIGITEIEKSS